MIIKSAEFVKSAAKPDQYPPVLLPEIAFAGRSNVGKSSLINTLLNRRRLARTSGTPGRTQLINFFVINQSFAFVDIPGFGYAKVPSAVKRKWGPMIETYLSTRATLKGIVLIMDIRRLPRQEELSLVDWLNHYHISSIMVLTKTDKISKSKQTTQVGSISRALTVDRNDLILFSAKTRQGRENLWRAIQAMLATDNA